jgi:hypothetical protein
MKGNNILQALGNLEARIQKPEAGRNHNSRMTGLRIIESSCDFNWGWEL